MCFGVSPLAAVSRQDGKREDQRQGAWNRGRAAAQIGNDADLNQARRGGDGEDKQEGKALCVARVCSREHGRRRSRFWHRAGHGSDRG